MLSSGLPHHTLQHDMRMQEWLRGLNATLRFERLFLEHIMRSKVETTALMSACALHQPARVGKIFMLNATC